MLVFQVFAWKKKKTLKKKTKWVHGFDMGNLIIEQELSLIVHVKGSIL